MAATLAKQTDLKKARRPDRRGIGSGADLVAAGADGAAARVGALGNTFRSEAPCRSVPRSRRDRLTRAAVQSGDDWRTVGACGRNRLVVAAWHPRRPTRPRADARPTVLSALSRLLRARSAPLRRGAARGCTPTALRQSRRRRLPHWRDSIVRSRSRCAGRGPRRGRCSTGSARGRNRILHRLRGVQARLVPARPSIRLMPSAVANGDALELNARLRPWPVCRTPSPRRYVTASTDGSSASARACNRRGFERA